MYFLTCSSLETWNQFHAAVHWNKAQSRLLVRKRAYKNPAPGQLITDWLFDFGRGFGGNCRAARNRNPLRGNITFSSAHNYFAVIIQSRSEPSRHVEWKPSKLPIVIESCGHWIFSSLHSNKYNECTRKIREREKDRATDLWTASEIRSKTRIIALWGRNLFPSKNENFSRPDCNFFIPFHVRIIRLKESTNFALYSSIRLYVLIIHCHSVSCWHFYNWPNRVKSIQLRQPTSINPVNSRMNKKKRSSIQQETIKKTSKQNQIGQTFQKLKQLEKKKKKFLCVCLCVFGSTNTEARHNERQNKRREKLTRRKYERRYCFFTLPQSISQTNPQLLIMTIIIMSSSWTFSFIHDSFIK